MGHVRVKVRIAHPNRRNRPIEVADALVDTGASFTTVPRQLADQLGLEVLGKHRTRTANGTIEIDRSFAYIEYDGRDEVMPVWISDSYPGVLIGVFTLEALGLAVDPSSGQLTSSEFLLL
jgi:clan AA aspartic protease